MHYKKYILPLLALAALMVTGCHQSVVEDAIVGSECQKEQLVTIRTYIQNGSPSLRAGETSWHPQSVGALPFEEAIYNAVLYVYRGTTLEKCMIYYTKAYGDANPSLPGLGQDRARMITPAKVNETMELSMDIELLPGTYDFIVVVNSHLALKQAMDSSDGKAGVDPSTIVYTSADDIAAFTTYDIDPAKGTNGIPKKMLPMVGQQSLWVPEPKLGEGDSDANRKELRPSIGLERVHARLEVTLITPHQAWDDKNPGYEPSRYRLMNVDLLGIGGYQFPLLPQQGETTAIDRKDILNTGALTPPTVVAPNTLPAAVDVGLGNDDTHFQNFGINEEYNAFGHRDGLKGGVYEYLAKPLLIKPDAADNYDITCQYGFFSEIPEEQTSKGVYVYLPPLYRSGTTEPAFVPQVKLTFKAIGYGYWDKRTGQWEPLVHTDTWYWVKLHNETAKKTGRREIMETDEDGTEFGTGQWVDVWEQLPNKPDDLWSIRRNTIYRLDLIFFGRTLKVNDYIVKEWEDQKVDIPW